MKALVGGLQSIYRWIFFIFALALLPQLFAGWGSIVHATRAGSPELVYGLYALFSVNSIVCGLAFWSLRNPRTTRSPWAIAACSLFLLYGLALLPYSRTVVAGLHLAVGLAVFGLTGVVLFSRKPAPAASATGSAKRPKLAGDRTHPWVDRASALVFIAATWAAIRFWYRWAEDRQLPTSGVVLSLTLFTVSILLTAFLHECGHALVARIVKMRVLAFFIGPLHWRKRAGLWTFQFDTSALGLGGGVRVAPTDPDQPVRNEVCMILAGPAVNILTGLCTGWATLHVVGSSYEWAWEFLALLTSFSLILAAQNLFPFRTRNGAYSDGAIILQLLTHSPLVASHRLVQSVTSTMVTTRRMRDLDADAFLHAAAHHSEPHRALHFYVCAAGCFEDRGLIPEAVSAMAAAEAVYNTGAVAKLGALHTCFIHAHATLHADAASSRLWWNRMIAEKAEPEDIDLWLARTALFFVEGRLPEAEEAWQRSSAHAARLPHFGAYEADRYRCALLRHHLDLAKSQPVQVDWRAEQACPDTLTGQRQSLPAAPALA